MGHPAKLVEDAGYFEALEIRWERPVCPQVSIGSGESILPIDEP